MSGGGARRAGRYNMYNRTNSVSLSFDVCHDVRHQSKPVDNESALSFDCDGSDV